jgi:hypothetical protein
VSAGLPAQDFCRRVVIILVVGCCVGTSSAWAIECLSAPNHSKGGWWSWREIEGRKCWFRKVGAVPPKSEFIWPEHVKEAQPVAEPAQPEAPLIQGTEARAATSPQIDVARVQIEVSRVKPVPAVRKFRLRDGLIDLMSGASHF